MRNCAAGLGDDGMSASALRGFRRSEAGRPVASERRPIMPLPKRVERIA